MKGVFFNSLSLGLNQERSTVQSFGYGKNTLLMTTFVTLLHPSHVLVDVSSLQRVQVFVDVNTSDTEM